MIKYAANDVIYLPKIYDIMLEILKGLKNLSITDVLKACELYLKYPNINESITQKTRDLPENSQIQGILK